MNFAQALYTTNREDISWTTLESGSVVFVDAPLLNEFVASILPKIPTPFVLVTHQGDTEINSNYAILLDNPKILRWYAQNLSFDHPRVFPLPIGLENQFFHNNGIVSDYQKLRKKRLVKKDFRIVEAFNLGTNPDKRYPCYRALWSNPLAVHFPPCLNSRVYRQQLVHYGFVASPPGNGLDCHRTWEAMYLRVVPVVENNLMNQRFYDLGLPLVLVDDWNSMRQWTPEFLENEYTRLLPRFDSEVLWAEWWKKEIQNIRISG